MAATEETTPRLVSPGQMASPSALDISMQIRSPSQPTTRQHGHSQSLSISSIGSPTRGGSRRKSMSSSANFNTIMQGMAASPAAHQSTFALASPHQKSPLHGYPSPPSSLPNEGAGLLNGTPSPATFTFPRRESLVPPAASSGLSSGQFINSTTPIATSKRNRRASEGAHALLDGAGKGAPGELRCDKCGKGYKHGSCLTKHLWEHTPEWSFTSKLLISKHQQVQLLEAASILVSMNPVTPPTSSSNSADGSDSNAINSDGSSTGDSPPPVIDVSPLPTPTAIPLARSTRARSSSKRLSRSFQPPSNFTVGSAPTHLPTSSGITKPRPRGSSFISSGSAQAAAQAAVNAVAASTVPGGGGSISEDESLAAAVGLLSCSFGGQTPSRSSVIDAKIGSLASPISPRAEVMMKIEESGVDDMAIDDDEEEEAAWSRGNSRGKSEEDDVGVFGKMEE